MGLTWCPSSIDTYSHIPEDNVSAVNEIRGRAPSWAWDGVKGPFPAAPRGGRTSWLYVPPLRPEGCERRGCEPQSEAVESQRVRTGVRLMLTGTLSSSLHQLWSLPPVWSLGRVVTQSVGVVGVRKTKYYHTAAGYRIILCWFIRIFKIIKIKNLKIN